MGLNPRASKCKSPPFTPLLSAANRRRRQRLQCPAVQVKLHEEIAILLTAFLLFAISVFGSVGIADAPLRSWPVLQRGDHDNPDIVRTLQLLLNARGYSVSADGSFGRETQKKAATVSVGTWPRRFEGDE